MSSFTSALSFQPVPSSVGPASPASSVGMRFGLRVAPSHKDGALRAELPAGWIHQPGHRLAAQHWVRHLFFLWLATCQASLRETKLYICIYLFASPSFCFHRDLLRVGVTLAGHQKKILSSIQTLRIHKAPPTMLYWPIAAWSQHNTQNDPDAVHRCTRSSQWERFTAWNTNWCSFNQSERRNEMTILWRAGWTSGFLLARLAEPHPEVACFFKSTLNSRAHRNQPISIQHRKDVGRLWKLFLMWTLLIGCSSTVKTKLRPLLGA